MEGSVSRITFCLDALLAAEVILTFPRNVVGLRKSHPRFWIAMETSLYSNLVQLFENMRFLNRSRSCVLFGITIAVVSVRYEPLINKYRGPEEVTYELGSI